MRETEVKTRELRSLPDVANFLCCKEITVITVEDEERMETIGGRSVHIIPVWKWLLQNEKTAWLEKH
jgi:predicted AAA+ superfamily ATPase